MGLIESVTLWREVLEGTGTGRGWAQTNEQILRHVIYVVCASIVASIYQSRSLLGMLRRLSITRTRGLARALDPSLRPTCCLPKQQSVTNSMSQIPSNSTSSTSFETIFNAALEEYEKKTKKEIASHPLAAELKSCDSPSAILAVLRAQVQASDQSQSADERLTKWLDPTVNVLSAFSAIVGDAVGLVSARF